MERKILLISRGSMFMVGAVEKSLTDAGFTVVAAAPSINDLNGKKDEADLILFYLGDYIEDIPEVPVFLKDLCKEENKSVAVIGNEEEFAVFFESFPEELAAEKYLRPLDIAATTRSLLALSMTEEIERERRQRMRQILLVDDDGAYLKMMKDWLSAQYQVTIVNSGMQAITWLANNQPDLILLDYEMPVTDGPQVLEMIRSEERTRALPVIFLTGKSDKASVMKVLAFKPAGYLLKSMKKETLLKELADFFAKQG